MVSDYANSELLEFTPDEIYNLVHPDDHEMIAQRYKDRQAGKVVPDSYEHRFIRKDGETRWARVTVTEVEIQGEQAFLGMYADVTERKRAEEEARRRATQAALIYEVGQRVSGQLELDALLSEIVTGVCDAFGYYGTMLLLLDEEGERLTLQSIAGGYAGAFPDGLWLAIGEGLTGHAAATGETQASGDVSQNPHYVRKAREITQSELAVPIESGGQVIGVLDIQSDELDAFDESDVVAMETLSTQIGIAIENARLLRDVRAHVEELAVLNELGQALTTRLDVEQVLDEAYRGASRLMDTANFYIVLYHPDKDEITFALDVVDGEIQKSHVTLRAGRGLAEHVIRSRAPLLITENLPALLKEMGVELGRRSALSWVGAPLIVGDRVLGMMAAIQSHAGSPAYDERDRDLLLAIASQTAIALQNAYLFEETQRQVTQLALINDVGERIAAVLDLESVLERAARLVQESFGYHHVGLFTLDRERDELVMRAGAGDFAHLVPLDHRLKLGQGIAGWAGRHGRSLLANDVDDEPRYVNLYPDAAPTRSELCVPIKVGGEVVGVLDVQSPQRDAFDDNDVMVIATVAHQIAVALENARLHGEILDHAEQLEQRVQERTRDLERQSVQLRVAAAVARDATSARELNDLLNGAVNLVRDRFGFYHAGIFLLDEQGEYAVLRAATGEAGRQMLERGHRLKVGETGMVGYVTAAGRPRIALDVGADAVHFKHPLLPDTRSEMALPFKVDDRIIGALDVQSTQEAAFDEEDAAILQTMADQLAVAIERLERSAELQAQYARLDAILRSTADGIVVTDSAGDVIQANPVAQAWLAQTLSPEEAARLREAVRSVATRTEEQPVELLELTGLDLEVKAAPILEPGLEEAAVAVIAIHDVSHLKSLDRMKNRFITNISHELRTPITTIKLYAHLMRKRSEKWEQYLDTLAHEADRQAQLVEDILEISRIDSGRLEIKPRPTSLNELTETVVASHRASAQERGLALEYRPAEPGPVALADPGRITQVLVNLVENAVRYTPQGGRVTVSTDEQKAEGRAWASVTVADTGMGIPEEELPHIFERFFRGHEPREMQLSGTGLGLSIVKEIVELHGGQVTVESEEGAGSVFTVWLPLAD